jgi:hypothetical protein
MTLRVLTGIAAIALLLYAGRVALMPLTTLAALLWILERTRWERDLFRYGYAAGGAYAFWAIAGVFLVGPSAADWVIEGIVAALPLLWLWWKPQSLAATCVCMLIFALELAITSISLRFARVGSEAHKVLVLHAALKMMVLASLVAGLIRTRRSRRRVSEQSVAP